MAKPTRAIKDAHPRVFTVIAAVAVVLLVVGGAVFVTQRLGAASAAAQARSYPVPAVSALKNVEATRAATKLTDCTEFTGGGGWVATGTVTNTTKKAHTYLVTVYFESGADVVNYAQSQVNVPAGTSAPWVAVKKFTIGVGGLTCKLVAAS